MKLFTNFLLLFSLPHQMVKLILHVILFFFYLFPKTLLSLLHEYLKPLSIQSFNILSFHIITVITDTKQIVTLGN